MKHDVPVTDAIHIPEHELIITASAAGGPGGQHVNKKYTRITVHWNVAATTALDAEQKERVLKKLASRLTSDGDLVMSYGGSRSQQHNKKMALAQLADTVRKALVVAKKRIATKIPPALQEARLQHKKQRSMIKKMRSKKVYDT